MYLYVFISLLTNHERIVSMFKNLNPLGDDTNSIYQKKQTDPNDN